MFETEPSIKLKPVFSDRAYKPDLTSTPGLIAHLDTLITRNSLLGHYIAMTSALLTPTVRRIWLNLRQHPCCALVDKLMDLMW
jgi:hypothetical protein